MSNGPLHSMTFIDAAEKVLRESACEKHIHYADLTRLAIEGGHIATEGRTPNATMNALIGRDIARRKSIGAEPRFVRTDRGMIGLAEAVPQGLHYEIAQHNAKARAALLAAIKSRTAEQFEILIERLLPELGFENVERTPFGTDSGIDLRGELLVQGFVTIKMAVQAKRWDKNVQRPAIQQVRGSLNPHEQGLIITTSDFSPGAKNEAARRDASPVALVNGEKLVELLATTGIGIHRESGAILSLDEASLSSLG